MVWIYAVNRQEWLRRQYQQPGQKHEEQQVLFLALRQFSPIEKWQVCLFPVVAGAGAGVPDAVAQQPGQKHEEQQFLFQFIDSFLQLRNSKSVSFLLLMVLLFQLLLLLLVLELEFLVLLPVTLLGIS